MAKNIDDVKFKDYEKHYNDESFWEKIKKFAKKAGSKVIYTALKLYYAMKRPDTPAWAKSVIVGALGYLILPVDVIPDYIPVVGFSDDLAVLAAALGTVAAYINEEVKDKARQKMKDWFGGSEIGKLED